MENNTLVNGYLKITPPLNKTEQRYLYKFSQTRRCKTKEGCYGTNHFYDNPEEELVINNEQLAQGQPSFWCNWFPSEDGTQLILNNTKNDSYALIWAKYLIKHFIGKKPLAKEKEPQAFSFLQGHTCDGEIYITQSNKKVSCKKIHFNPFKKITQFITNITQKIKAAIYKEKTSKIQRSIQLFIDLLGTTASKQKFTEVINKYRLNTNIKINHTVLVGILPNGAPHHITIEQGDLLMFAAAHSNKNAIEALIELGANTTNKDKHGRTALAMLSKKVQQPFGEYEYLQTILGRTPTIKLKHK